MLECRKLVFLTVFAIAIQQCISSLHFINDGITKSFNQVNSFIQSQEPIIGSNTASCLNCIDCTVAGNGHSICNQIFSTKFDSLRNGIAVDVIPSMVVTYSNFDSVYSPKFSGAQVAEFCKAFSKSSTCILFAHDNIDDYLVAYDQVFRRLFDSTNPAGFSLIIAGEITTSKDDITKKIINYLIDNEVILSGQESLVKIFFTSSDADIVSSLADVPDSFNVPYAEVSQVLTDAWNTATLNPMKPVISNAAKRSLVQVESAYTASMVFIESMVSQWQARVGSGKIVSGFGSRVEELNQSVQNRFRDRTLGVMVAKERAERSKQLVDTIRTATESLHRQQAAILQISAKGSFIKSLRKLIAGDASKVTPENQQQLLRQALFDFQTKMADLDIPSLKITADIIKSDIADTLRSLLADFPESPIAKLEELKKIDKTAKNPQPKQGRAVNVALTLVGMFRPPGYGNLQGYFNYATSVAGTPLNFLLGVQNDGDAPDIVGDDREYPLLRLQPKLNFDIDL